MTLYDLSKQERATVVKSIASDVLQGRKTNTSKKILLYFSDEDTYIRKSAYLSVGVTKHLSFINISS
jgi:hypothetical protein